MSGQEREKKNIVSVHERESKKSVSVQEKKNICQCKRDKKNCVSA